MDGGMGNVRVRPGKAGLVAAMSIFSCVYVVGLGSDSWYRTGVSPHLVAHLGIIGIINACGFYENITLAEKDLARPTFSTSDSECISLFQSKVPDWFRAVQVLSVVCLCLLCVVVLMWAYIICLDKLVDKRVSYPFFLLWVTTGLLMLAHPVIFACNLRPDRQVLEGYLTAEVVVSRLYWAGFFLHCVVAAGFNFTAVAVALCVYCVHRRS